MMDVPGARPHRRARHSHVRVAAAGAILAAFATLTPAAGTNITVNSLNDAVNGSDGKCSLREAIRAADTDLAVNECPGGSAEDTITLPAGTIVFDGGPETYDEFNGVLTIRGATSNRDDSTVSCGLSSSGRFLSVLDTSSVTLENFTVALCRGGSNTRGGAIRVDQSHLTLRNMYFLLNIASFDGGAVYFLAEGRTLRIEDSTFANNLSDGGSPDSPALGGAVSAFLTSGQAIIERTLFSNNALDTATQASFGGGLKIESIYSAKVTLREVEFADNQCADSTNYHYGCGLYLNLWDTSQAVVDGFEAYGGGSDATNTLSLIASGAAITLHDTASLTLDRCHLYENRSPLIAAESDHQLLVEAVSGSTALVRNCLLHDGGTGFGGFASGTANLRFDHLTATANGRSGVVSNSGLSSSLALQNSILWDNTVGLYQSGTVTLASNNLEATNPGFVNAGAGDFHLLSSSLDRDAGDRTLTGVGLYDLDHAGRVGGTQTDRGAYEYGGIFADGFESGDTSAWSI